MFDNSKDILNYALTASVLTLTFFMAWILWYIVKMFRDIEKVIRQMTVVMDKFSSVLDFTKDQIRNASAVIPIIIKAGEKIADMIRSIRDRKADQDDAEKQSQNKNRKRKSDF